MIRLVCLSVGYLFGNFQTGYFYGRSQGIDIRRHGSGNAGTTNALRVMGTKAGAVVFAGDFLKLLLAVLLLRFLLPGGRGSARLLITLYTAVGVVLGHDFPVFLGFRGGKGIAVTAGLLLMLDWRLFLLGNALFWSIFITTHLVSLGSCVVILSTCAGYLWLIARGQLPLGDMSRTEACTVYGLWAVLALFQHRDNIRRLLQGSEGRVYLKSRQETARKG